MGTAHGPREEPPSPVCPGCLDSTSHRFECFRNTPSFLPAQLRVSPWDGLQPFRVKRPEGLIHTGHGAGTAPEAAPQLGWGTAPAEQWRDLASSQHPVSPLTASALSPPPFTHKAPLGPSPQPVPMGGHSTRPDCPPCYSDWAQRLACD